MDEMYCSQTYTVISVHSGEMGGMPGLKQCLGGWYVPHECQDQGFPRRRLCCNEMINFIHFSCQRF